MWKTPGFPEKMIYRWQAFDINGSSSQNHPFFADCVWIRWYYQASLEPRNHIIGQLTHAKPWSKSLSSKGCFLDAQKTAPPSYVPQWSWCSCTPRFPHWNLLGFLDFLHWEPQESMISDTPFLSIELVNHTNTLPRLPNSLPTSRGPNIFQYFTCDFPSSCPHFRHVIKCHQAPPPMVGMVTTTSANFNL